MRMEKQTKCFVHSISRKIYLLSNFSSFKTLMIRISNNQLLKADARITPKYLILTKLYSNNIISYDIIY